MIRLMVVNEVHTSALFTVSDQAGEARAIQTVDRLEAQGQIYAATRVEVGDLVLVAEVPALLTTRTIEDMTDSVSHIIIGIVPPSMVKFVPNYDKLVKR